MIPYPNSTKVIKLFCSQLLGSIKQIRQIKVVDVVSDDNVRISLERATLGMRNAYVIHTSLMNFDHSSSMSFSF